MDSQTLDIMLPSYNEFSFGGQRKNEYIVILSVCYVHSSASPAQQMTVLLQQAKQYAYSLLSDWSLSRCGDSLLIFYSRHDNVVSVVIIFA
jgi:hypothetical protein